MAKAERTKLSNKRWKVDISYTYGGLAPYEPPAERPRGGSFQTEITIPNKRYALAIGLRALFTERPHLLNVEHFRFTHLGTEKHHRLGPFGE